MAINSSLETPGGKDKTMEFTGLTSSTRCIKCGKVIAVTRQAVTDEGAYTYITENKDCRFIDRWGCERNFCKKCIR